MPLVPVILKGLREMRPKGSREITPGPVSVTFLAPIHVSREMAVEDATVLLQSTMNREFGKPRVFPTGLSASDGLEKAA